MLAAAKDLQERFSSLEATQKTRAQILAGELPADPVFTATEAADETQKKDGQLAVIEEEKKEASDGAANNNNLTVTEQHQNQADAKMDSQAISNRFSISQASTTNHETKKADIEGQVARVE